jgi:GntR family transcriptional regulator, transcriptional repressor for pyruvate dehydrogenase complex
MSALLLAGEDDGGGTDVRCCTIGADAPGTRDWHQDDAVTFETTRTAGRLNGTVGPARRTTLAQTVAEAIKQLIVADSLGPGDRLPSEHELCRQLEVSRLVVREALQGLMAVGLVKVRHGKGAYVAGPGEGPVAELLTFGLTDDVAAFRQMLELRLILECGAIDLAATGATDSSLAPLRAALESMRQAASDGRSLEDADREFHRAILVASGNVALARLAPVIDEFFRLKTRACRPSIGWRPAGAEVVEHAAILAAIEHGDAQAGRERLRAALAIYAVALDDASPSDQEATR